MDVTRVDAYLLGTGGSKADAIAQLLAHPASRTGAAAAFARALDAVGVRAADEALIALRVVLSGLAADDERIRRLRALCALSRAAEKADLVAIRAQFKKDAPFLRDLSAPNDDAALLTFVQAIRGAYGAEVSPAS